MPILQYFRRSLSFSFGLSCGIGRSTVGDYIQRGKIAGLNWPLPEGLSDTALEQTLFPSPTPRNSSKLFPDFPEVHKELQSRKHVTLMLLWQEYKEQYPEGYQNTPSESVAYLRGISTLVMLVSYRFLK